MALLLAWIHVLIYEDCMIRIMLRKTLTDLNTEATC